MYLPLATGLKGAAVLLLLLIGWQDWRTRSVTWLLFPLLGVVLLGHHWLMASSAAVGWALLVNWTILGGLLAILSLYVRLRFVRLKLRLQDCLGSGDVVFWFVAASYFSPPAFLLYFLASSLLALVAFGLLCQMRLVGPDRRVPLAGLQAVGLVLLLVCAWVNPAWSIDAGEAQFLIWAAVW
ncbi:MAG TPA: hypothetical protein VF690_17825 [Hymenobacter sp.]|jgi:hypothetical protein